MTTNERRIEIEDYVIKGDGKVMRWMNADEFLDRANEAAQANSGLEKRYEVFRRMMEAI